MSAPADTASAALRRAQSRRWRLASAWAASPLTAVGFLRVRPAQRGALLAGGGRLLDAHRGGHAHAGDAASYL